MLNVLMLLATEFLRKIFQDKLTVWFYWVYPLLLLLHVNMYM